MQIKIEAMKMEHLPSVYHIEKNVFPLPWEYETFVKEISSNPCAYYIVANCELHGVVGYGGMWIVFEDSHITTVAVDSDYRRQKIGERLLISLIEICFKKKVRSIDLEVRRYNTPAQKLYLKYKFSPVNIRCKYYRDTDEDAIVLKVKNIHSADFLKNFISKKNSLLPFDPITRPQVAHLGV